MRYGFRSAGFSLRQVTNPPSLCDLRLLQSEQTTFAHPRSTGRGTRPTGSKTWLTGGVIFVGAQTCFAHHPRGAQPPRRSRILRPFVTFRLGTGGRGKPLPYDGDPGVGAGGQRVER